MNLNEEVIGDDDRDGSRLAVQGEMERLADQRGNLGDVMHAEDGLGHRLQ